MLQSRRLMFAVVGLILLLVSLPQVAPTAAAAPGRQPAAAVTGTTTATPAADQPGLMQRHRQEARSTAVYILLLYALMAAGPLMLVVMVAYTIARVVTFPQLR